MRRWYWKPVTSFAYLLCLIITVSPTYSLAAAWNRPAGELQLLQTYFYYQVDESFDADGNHQPQEKFLKHEYKAYAEYGVDEHWTVGGAVSFQHLRQEASPVTQTAYGIGDVELLVRTPLWQQNGMVLAVQPWVKLPLGDQLATDLPLGSEGIDGELRLLYGLGHNYAGLNHFAGVELAYRARQTEDASDQLYADATLGLRNHMDSLWLAQLFSTFAVQGHGASGFRASNGNNYDSIKGQLSWVYNVQEDTALQLGYSHDLWGKNTGAGNGFLLSLWLNF